MPRPLFYSGGGAYPRGVDGATMAGQHSRTSLISWAFLNLWPRRPEISFCHTTDQYRTILYYVFLDLVSKRRYCRFFTPRYGLGGLTGSRT
jgi:hypothetical protein